MRAKWERRVRAPGLQPRARLRGSGGPHRGQPALSLARTDDRFGAPLDAARNDIEKLREIPKLINEIKPGLYLEIQKCDYTIEDFARVQNIIRQAVSS